MDTASIVRGTTHVFATGIATEARLTRASEVACVQSRAQPAMQTRMRCAHINRAVHSSKACVARAGYTVRTTAITRAMISARIV